MIIEKLTSIMTVYETDSFEYLIANYLLKKQDEIINIKLLDVLEEIHVSKSTLSRFCKSLGCKNYTELQYQIFHELLDSTTYRNSIRMNEYFPIELFKGRKRIIILGDSISISPLMAYKLQFSLIGINLEFRLFSNNYISLLKSYQVQKDDIVLYISLFKSNLELFIDIFNEYIDIINYLKNKNIPFVFIGKMSQRNENEENYIKITDDVNMSDRIYQLCIIFEQIYYALVQ